jgi:hypothetical protein
LYNADYLLSYIILFTMVLIASHSEFWEKNLTPHFHQFFFRDDLLHPLLKKNVIMKHNIRTY